MQLQMKDIFPTRLVIVALALVSLFAASVAFAAQAKLQKDKTPAAPQKQMGDAGTQIDAGSKPEQALAVKMNVMYKGTLSASTDKEDIYKFQVKKGAPFTINVGNDLSSSSTLYMEVLYANGKPLEEEYDATADPDPGEGEQVVVDNAPAETLFIRFRTNKGNLGYSFNIVGKAD